MAITLDELLGRNTTRNSTQTVERFPTYEDYLSSRSREKRAAAAEEEPRYNYNFQARPNSASISEESVRRTEASRPYTLPESREYQDIDYDSVPIFNRPQLREGGSRANRGYASEASAIYGAGVSTAEREYTNRERSNREYANENYASEGSFSSYNRMSNENYADTDNFYRFTQSDNDRLPDGELLNKLSHTNAGRRPLFDKAQGSVAAVDAVRGGEFVSQAKKREALAEKTGTKRARLNTKGKLILGAYIALIVTVAVLIIVNAGSINKGTAKIPSSSLSATSVSQSADR